MRFTILAAGAGMGIGLLRGGRLRFLAYRTLRLWPLLGAGVALQIMAGLLDGKLGLALLLASFTALVGFAAVNVAIVGMWLVATGIALNMAVIALNSGMPVRPAALVDAAITEPGREATVRLGTKHHLERPSDRLTVLADIIPVAPLREVLSFGDLVLAVGAADVVVHLMAPAVGRRTAEASAVRG